MRLNRLKFTSRSTTLVALSMLTITPVFAQSWLGHEYEFEAAPIREGEQPVIFKTDDHHKLAFQLSKRFHNVLVLNILMDL